MTAATDNVAVYVDLLGFRSLLTQRPTLRRPHGWDLTHVYQANLQSIDRLGSYDDSESQVALQMRTEAGYGGDQTMVLRVPPGAGWMPRAS